MTDRVFRRHAGDHSSQVGSSHRDADDPSWTAGAADVAAYAAFAPAPAPQDAPVPASDAPQQVVFIEGSVADAQLLAEGVAPGVVAVILDPTADGIQQIAAWLAMHDSAGLAAIDIVADGADGSIRLGRAVLDAASLPGYQAELAAIGSALAPGGAIQIYGCDVAQDDAGKAFLQQISTATGGASVAAASHLVGAASGGGSWTLDFDTGAVTASAPFTAAAMSAYPDELSVTTNQLFVAFNYGLGSSLTRIEQIGVSGAAAGATRDIIDDQTTNYFQTFGGLAIDAPLNEYFVVDDSAQFNGSASGTDSIFMGSLNGGAPTAIFNAPLGDEAAYYAITGLALDQPGGYLYFSYASALQQSAIYKLNIATHVETAVTTSTNVMVPQDLSLDLADNLIFFVDSDSFGDVNNLDVANLATGQVTTLNAQLGTAINNLLALDASATPNEAFLTGIAVDPTTHTLIFSAQNASNQPYNLIARATFSVTGDNVTLSNVTTLYSGAAAHAPGSIVLDTQNQIFYVGSSNDQSVYESAMTGGGLTRVYQETTATGANPAGLAFLSTPTVIATGSLNYAQNAPAVTLAASATVTNSDGQDLASATVSIAGGTASFGDTLSATVTGTGIAASYNASNETLTLTGVDTIAHYQQVLDSVKFSSTGATAGTRTIDWTVSDGVITSPTATSSITVHDAPAITAGATATFAGGGPAVALDSGLVVTDASSAVESSATVTIGGYIAGDTLTVGTPGGLATSFSNGTLTLSGTASLATYQAALDSVAYGFSPANGDPTGGDTHTSRTISWTANNGFVNSAAATSTLNVQHVAPTVTAGASVAFTGGSATPVVLDSGLTLADPDSGGLLTSATVTLGGFIAGDQLNFTNQNGITGSYDSAAGVLTLSGSTSVANYQAALQSVTYQFNPSDGDPTGGGSHANRTVIWAVSDGVSSGTASSALNEVHVSPTVIAGGSATYPENAAPLALDPTLTVTDPDSGGVLTGATVSIAGGFLAGDTLNFTDQNGIAGSYNGATGVLTLTGTASIAQYQAALQSVAYSFPGDPTNHLADNSRTISWTVTDGVGSSTAVTSSLTVLCFCAGTHIATQAGEVPVERLSPGDMVLTASGAIRPIVWIGKGRQLVTRGRRSAATPVIVERGALGPQIPSRDLHLTKAHALLVDGVLIPAEFLVNHRSIRWDDRAQEVTLYHIELESHDVLIADGAPAESYRDDGNRWLFQNANSGWGLPPQGPCAPILTGGPRVDAAWRRFLDRCGPRNLPPLTEDPDLHLMVDGRRVDAETRRGDTHIFRVPASAGSVRIASRAAVPAELGWARDPRLLGVALRRIVLRRDSRFVTFEASDCRLSAGFHGYEPADDLRWTDGDAALPITPLSGTSEWLEIVLCLVGGTRYLDCGNDAGQAAA